VYQRAAVGHIVKQYVNNPIEVDHGCLKVRLRPMRGLKRFRSARVISAGHAFVQNLGRGRYELGVDIDRWHRLTAAFSELARAIWSRKHSRQFRLLPRQRNRAYVPIGPAIAEVPVDRHHDHVRWEPEPNQP
jgi:hypothetical protein